VTSALLAVLFLATGVGFVGYLQPVAAVKPSLIAIPSETVAPLSLPWPSTGQAAVGAAGFGVVDQYQTQRPAPIASTAKIITALVVLEAKPLQPGQQGPNITFTAQDEDIYNSYISQGGSVYPVTAGESISQRQAMEALLIMSANNIADMLATWAYGSMDSYVAAANEYAAKHGMETMTIADASGFAPKTAATASDLVMAGELLMRQQLLASIVSQKFLTIPGIGRVPSTNTQLGNGVVGIKTGNTDEAGGCFVIAITHEVRESETVTIIAAVMGAKDVPTAMAAARAIAQDSRSGFAASTLVERGQTIARYELPWGETLTATAQQDLVVTRWLPESTSPVAELQSVGGELTGGTVLGNVSVADTQVPVVAATAVDGPGLLWRAFGRYL
jgi:D-alanyl-D-alanine carboxypeptidase (penicillin-binding protein 5/6)